MSALPPWFERLGHDLRGPLAPMQTATYLLRSGQLDAKQQQELLEVIDRQAKRLGDMIEEMVDWSLVHQGRLLGRRGDCEASLLLADALAGMATSDRAPPAILDDGGTALVHGDPMRLTQLLRILLRFASSRGGAAAPSVTVQQAEGVLCIDVVSGESAMDDHEADRLLQEPMAEPYDQGLGLRLLIASAIAEAHGGSLVAHDGVGGLRLHCRLPLAVPAAD